MKFYNIPNTVRDGFKLIINLTKTDIEKLKIILETSTIGQDLGELTEQNISHFDLSTFELLNIFASLRSTVPIYINSKDTVEKFSSDFVGAYSYITKTKDKEILDKLESHLTSLISSFSVLIKTYKSRNLLTENKNNFLKSRIVSDIRIVFDDEKDISEKKQCALVVHHLKIDFFSAISERKEFFVSLNLKDLENLKNTVERALKKDKLIKENNHALTFVDIS
jgi:hypothetical protein